MNANATQVGGAHYAAGMQHWDLVGITRMGYFEGQITKYVTRWRKKNGVEDLRKAEHFMQKMRELFAAGQVGVNTYVERFALPLHLYQFALDNRLWYVEQEIIRATIAFNDDNDLSFAQSRIRKLIERHGDRDANALMHERDPESAAVKSKPDPHATRRDKGREPAPQVPRVGVTEYDSDDYGKRYPDTEYAISVWYIAQSDRHGFAPMGWLELSPSLRGEWRRAYAGRNTTGAVDPHGKPCDDAGATRRETTEKARGCDDGSPGKGYVEQ